MFARLVAALVAALALGACNTLGDRTTVAADCGDPARDAPVYELSRSAPLVADEICARAEAWDIRDLRVKATGDRRIRISLEGGDEPHHLIRPGRLQVYDVGLNAYEDPQTATGHSIVPFTDLHDAVRLASQRRPRREPGERPGDRHNDTYADRYYLFTAEVEGRRGHVPPERPDGADLGDAYVSCADLLEDYETRRTFGPPPGPRPVAVDAGSECRRELRKLGNYGPPEGSVVLRVRRGVAVVTDRGASPWRHYVIEDDAEITNAGIERAKADGATLDLELTSTGAGGYRDLVDRLAGRGRRAGRPSPPLAVVMDARVLGWITVTDSQRPPLGRLELDDVGGEDESARLATLIEHPLAQQPRRRR